ncbi:hypothetical protein CTI14_59005, partial [Methylobacterium radiotolerans]
VSVPRRGQPLHRPALPPRGRLPPLEGPRRSRAVDDPRRQADRAGASKKRLAGWRRGTTASTASSAARRTTGIRPSPRTTTTSTSPTSPRTATTSRRTSPIARC